MGQDNAARDEQSQADTPEPTSGGAIHLVEPIPDAVELVGRNTDTLITDADLHSRSQLITCRLSIEPVLTRTNTHTDRTTLGAELDRVVQQVVHNLAETPGIAL
jgi:hypothetical protein